MRLSGRYIRLYFSEFGTLPVGADATAAQRAGVARPLERVSDPGTYQAFRHFPMRRAAVPERSWMLILNGTSFPKQGRRSVAAARQYCGTLDKWPTAKSP